MPKLVIRKPVLILILLTILLVIGAVSVNAKSYIDGFSDTTQWAIKSGSVTANGTCHIGGSQINQITYKVKTPIEGDFVFQYDIKFLTSNYRAWYMDVNINNATNGPDCVDITNNNHISIGETDSAVTYDFTTYRQIKYYYYDTNTTIKIYVDDELAVSALTADKSNLWMSLSLYDYGGETNYAVIDNFYYDTTGVNQTNITASIAVDYDPVTLFTNQTGALVLNASTYSYNEVQWFYDTSLINQYKQVGSQWQTWNGSAWVNCDTVNVFTQSYYVASAEDHAFSARVMNDGQILIAAYKSFHVADNATQTLYYFRVTDNNDADLSNFTGQFWQSENPGESYAFNFSGYGATLDLNRHYQGSVDADGYISGVIAFETTYNQSYPVTYRTINIKMVGSDTPTDPTHAFLDVKVYDAVTNEMLPDAVFTLAYASNGSSKPYYIYGTIKRVEIIKGTAYTWKAASSSYYSMTGTVNMTDSQAMLLIPLNPIPAPTATPTTPGGSGGNIGGTTATLTPDQRENQAMTMIDQLLEAGPSLMQLAILAVFMGLVMMLFPGGSGGRKRYYR
jgi:hypothetical protein